MAKIGEQELKAQLKNGAFSHAYFIYGEENYLKEFYIQKLREKTVDSAFADFNFHQHEGKNSTMDDILMDAQMLPMMSAYSVVLVHDYPLDKSAADIDKLKEFLEDVPESCILIFWCDTLETDTKKNAKWRAVENMFAAAGDAVQLDKRSEAELVKLISHSAKKRGCCLEAAQARYLISVVGSDIHTLFNELEKLCAYVQEGEITRRTIDALAVKCLQARIFDLSRFLLRGDSDGAFRVLQSLFAQKEEPISIMAVIASCYVDMYRVKCAKMAGVNENELTQFFSYKGREFLIRNALRDSAGISLEALRRALDILSETDIKMKSTAIDKNLLLEETLIKLLGVRYG